MCACVFSPNMARVELETKSDGKRELLIEKKGIDLRVLFCTWYSLRAFFFVCVFFSQYFLQFKKKHGTMYLAPVPGTCCVLHVPGAYVRKLHTGIYGAVSYASHQVLAYTYQLRTAVSRGLV